VSISRIARAPRAERAQAPQALRGHWGPVNDVEFTPHGTALARARGVVPRGRPAARDGADRSAQRVGVVVGRGP